MSDTRARTRLAQRRNIPRGRDPINIRAHKLGLPRVVADFFDLRLSFNDEHCQIDDGSYDESFALMQELRQVNDATEVPR